MGDNRKLELSMAFLIYMIGVISLVAMLYYAISNNIKDLPNPSPTPSPTPTPIHHTKPPRSVIYT